MAKITLFRNFTQIIGEKTLIELINDVKSEEYKEPVLAIRKLISEDKKKEADELKKKLPAFTPSGRFEGGRTLKYLKDYEPCICVDFDKLTYIQLTNGFGRMCDNPFVHACFISPSGNGLKVFVKVNSSQEQHPDAFAHVMQHLQRRTSLDADSSGKDITRLCFVSYDPRAYYNEDSRTFEVDPSEIIKPIITAPTKPTAKACPINTPPIEAKPPTSPRKTLEDTLRFTLQKYPFTPGNRNNFIHKFACNANRDKHPQADAEAFSLNFVANSGQDLTKEEIIASVNSGYSNTHEHGINVEKRREFAEMKKREESLINNTPLTFTPLNLQKKIIEGAQATPSKMLFGEFWLEGDLCVLYANTNIGKSVLALQIADSISTGNPIDGFKMEIAAQKILYFDFEMSTAHYVSRYAVRGEDVEFNKVYPFSHNILYCPMIEPEKIPDSGMTEKMMIGMIEKTIVDYDTKHVIIDNIGHITDDLEEAKKAGPFLKKLQKIKKQYNLSMLILAHIPKIEEGIPISINHLAGSKKIINYIDSAFSIGKSSRDPSIRYIKQMKSRFTDIIYGEDNVCVCTIGKIQETFLGFTFAGLSSESSIIKPKTEKEKETFETTVKDFMNSYPEDNPNALAIKIYKTLHPNTEPKDEHFNRFRHKIRRAFEKIKQAFEE